MSNYDPLKSLRRRRQRLENKLDHAMRVEQAAQKRRQTLSYALDAVLVELEQAQNQPSTDE